MFLVVTHKCIKENKPEDIQTKFYISVFLMNHTTYLFFQSDHVYIAGEKYNEMTSEMNVNNGEYG